LLSKRIREIDAPTLIVWGKLDKLIPPGEAETLHKAIAKSEEPKMLNCGHIPQEEAPEETAPLIQEFAERLHVKSRIVQWRSMHVDYLTRRTDSAAASNSAKIGRS